MRTQRLIATYVSFKLYVVSGDPFLTYLFKQDYSTLIYCYIYIYLMGCDYSADQFTCMGKLLWINTIYLEIAIF